MGNTKALEVARPDHNKAFEYATLHTGKEPAVTHLENLADAYLDLRTQLAERYAQLAEAVSALKMVDKGLRQKYIKDWVLVRGGDSLLLSDVINFALQATRQPTQEKGGE